MMERHLTQLEQSLVSAMIARGDWSHLLDKLGEATVEEQADGGMGSLRFKSGDEARFGEKIAELRFTDADGVEVSAALNVDKEGRLFELDLFKADFTPLIAIPSL